MAEYFDVKRSNGMNITENKLYDAMLEVGLNPKPQYEISQMKVDFAFPDIDLVVEVNGPHHYTEEYKLIDKKRLFILNKEGWKRRTYKASRVYDNPQAVALIIKRQVKKMGGHIREVEQPKQRLKKTKTNYLTSDELDDRFERAVRKKMKSIGGIISEEGVREIVRKEMMFDD